MKGVNDYLHARASALKVPVSGIFELSPVCNFACKMCYVRRTPGQIRAMGKRLRTADEWLALARQCREKGMLYLLLTGGEPFLYPEFRRLYTTLHQMGFAISINSNGTLIDDDTVAWLKKAAPTRINITLYGASPETYGRVCGDPTGYSRTVNAIEKLRAAGIPVVINASMIPENADDMARIIRFGKERNLNTRVGTYMFPPVRREGEAGDSRFSARQAAEMAVHKSRCLYDGPQQFAQWVRHELKQVQSAAAENEATWGAQGVETMRCRAGRCSFTVNWDGSMQACGMVPFPLQVYPFAQGFAQCWDTLTETVRKAEVLRGCAGCSKRELCHPCVAMVMAETGTANDKPAYLCEMAEHTYQILCELSQEEQP